jgi:hypothetical protein
LLAVWSGNDQLVELLPMRTRATLLYALTWLPLLIGILLCEVAFTRWLNPPPPPTNSDAALTGDADQWSR